MNLSPKAQSTLILVIAGLLVLWYLKGKASQAADKVVEAVNPADQNNLANRGFDSLYQMFAGENRTLGGDIADWLHGEE